MQGRLDRITVDSKVVSQNFSLQQDSEDIITVNLTAR